MPPSCIQICVPRYLSNKLSKYLHHQQQLQSKQEGKLKHPSPDKNGRRQPNGWEKYSFRIFFDLAVSFLVSFSAFGIMFFFVSLFFFGFLCKDASVGTFPSVRSPCFVFSCCFRVFTVSASIVCLCNIWTQDVGPSITHVTGCLYISHSGFIGSLRKWP